MPTTKHILRPVVVLAVAALALTGCSSGNGGDSGSGSGKIAIVASTNVYGDIASTIAGDAAEVTSVMTDPAQDPHSFEANARTQLAISKADILIENGGGYDDFMDTMKKASKNTKATVLNVVDISGKDDGKGELNEHVWYDFPTVKKFADELTTALSKADPSHKADFEKRAADFSSKLDALNTRTAELKQKYAGEGVAITEPVPLYLLDAIGLDNRTPDEFSEAIEAESDVPPAALKETLALFSDHQVKLLALNAQTTGPESEQVQKAATDAGIPVVQVTETLPDGKDYVGWMNANIDAISAALAK